MSAPGAVALAGPFPPTRSGIAVYNARVAAALRAQGIRTHCFADGLDRSGLPISVGPTFPVAALGELVDPDRYDALLWTLGNNVAHAETLAALMRVGGGTVWAHDTRLVNLHRTRAERIGTPERAGAYLAAVRAACRLPARPGGLDALERAGVTMMEPALAAGASVVVHSEPAARQLAAATPGPARPTLVVPLAVPDRRMLAVPALARDRDLVVSFGFVTAAKDPFTLLRALARLRRRRSVRLVFAGASGQATVEVQIRLAARRLGVADAVRITGFCPPAEYGRWLARAGVAVQLRTAWSGESSGAVADAIGAGVPVVTNLVSCADLPAGVVTSVPAAVDPADLADAIAAAAAGPAPAARDWAREHSFARVARQVAAFAAAHRH